MYTRFENFLSKFGEISEIHGFKLGVEFATKYLEEVHHPYYKDAIEASRALEWLREPIPLNETGEELTDDDFYSVYERPEKVSNRISEDEASTAEDDTIEAPSSEDVTRINIQERREALSLSRQELADAVGITVKQLRDYETGKVDPHVDVAIRIAIQLGCEAENLYTPQGEEDGSE